MRIIFTLGAVLAIAGAQDSRKSESFPTGALRDLILAGTDIAQVFDADFKKTPAFRVIEEGFVHKSHGSHAKAIASFERLGKEFPDAHRTTSWMLVVWVHRSQNDHDGAVAAIERDLAAPGGDEIDRRYAQAFLARTHEKRGDWQRALDAWKKAESPGTAQAEGYGLGPEVAKEFGIARCEFRLGKVDDALKRLEGLLLRLREALAAPKEGTDLRHWEASTIAFTYAELSGRSGRVEAAKKLAATAPSPAGTLLTSSLKIVDAWLSKDPAAIAKVVADARLGPAQKDGAAALIADLGQPGVDFLKKGIEAGTVTVIQLAGASQHRELLPLLQKHFDGEGPVMEAAVEAYLRLDAETKLPEPPPAK